MHKHSTAELHSQRATKHSCIYTVKRHHYNLALKDFFSFKYSSWNFLLPVYHFTITCQPSLLIRCIFSLSQSSYSSLVVAKIIGSICHHGKIKKLIS